MYVIRLEESSKKYRDELKRAQEQRVIITLGGKIYECRGMMYKKGIYGVFEEDQSPFLNTVKINGTLFSDFIEVGGGYKWKHLRNTLSEYIQRNTSPEDLVFLAKVLGIKHPELRVVIDTEYYIKASEAIATHTLANKTRSYVLSPEMREGSMKDARNVVRILKNILLQTN